MWRLRGAQVSAAVQLSMSFNGVLARASLQLASSKSGLFSYNVCLHSSILSCFPQSHGSLSMTKKVSISSHLLAPQKHMGLVANALRGLLLSCLLLGDLNDLSIARAAVFAQASSTEQQVEPSKGNCATCLGVVDETLGACGAAPNCVSTFDDRPAFFIAPWEFPGTLSKAFEQMKRALIQEGGEVVEKGDRYMHVVFRDQDGTFDDLEVLFSIPSEDATVNIRSASRKLSLGDNGRNQKRLERVRQALMWEEVPVLRNRSRKLFFLESPWDTFGPEPPPAFDYSDKLEFIPD